RLGVLGLGNRGKFARGVHRPGDAAVVWAADPDTSAHDRAREWFGPRVRTTTDHRDLLEADLDAVLILTPDHTHEELAVEFLSNNVACFVEKPLAITIEGCDRILETARKHGVRLYVGHNMRHMNFVLLM